MKIKINDDFDLYKIAYSGQCFRVKELPNNTYRFISGDRTVSIVSLEGPGEFSLSCNSYEWSEFWAHYFDLETDYSSIRASIPSSDKYIHRAAMAGAGIRILNQDPFEMLISFIISQRKSIPAIKSSVEKLCRKFGHRIERTEEEDVYSFPTPEEMSGITSDDLNDCGLGYRIPFILDAVSRVNSGVLDLQRISELSDEDLFSELKTVCGVGDKVANCISLFAYHRTGRAPVDTWIAKVIDSEYGGINPFPRYGNNAGIIQQYVFYGAQHEKNI